MSARSHPISDIIELSAVQFNGTYCTCCIAAFMYFDGHSMLLLLIHHRITSKESCYSKMMIFYNHSYKKKEKLTVFGFLYVCLCFMVWTYCTAFLRVLACTSRLRMDSLLEFQHLIQLDVHILLLHKQERP